MEGWRSSACSTTSDNDAVDDLDNPGNVTQPIVCSLTPEGIRAGRARLLPGLADRALACEATEGGYRLTFGASSDILRAITDVIDAERQCCRWLSFALTVPASGGPVTLMLTGPPGAREFLDALFEG
jgi:hypothetical protein